MNLLRPVLKTVVRQRLISNSLFTRAANPKVIKKILEQAYPSGKNIDEELIEILYNPLKEKTLRKHFVVLLTYLMTILLLTFSIKLMLQSN